ncbi:hypothetical protein BT96DRAFT_918295 [Gymnopus androsaceus JB14]|uniref:Peptidase S53 domain-containing protein n=1 Tax=Gymnopus androsaceus JB14 TaxID=1447944 RepID=A0A6A4HVR0_9AGAR|nr:hypothetical protein BT96DRAFT_918295 [Gymnopus androsaceus JB14]
MLAFLALACAYSFLVQASGLTPFVLHEKRAHIPYGWSHERKYDASAVLPLRFGLKQANIHKLEEYLYDIADPVSPNFGKHWTAGKVAETFAPSSESIKTVYEWLSGSGIAPERFKITSSKSWIELDATVEEAEKLMLTEYHVYKHKSGQTHIACDEYHLPDHVAPHIDIVMPSVHFDAIVRRPKSMIRDTTPKSDITIVNLTYPGVDHCDTQISLDCLRTFLNSYGIVEYTPATFIQSDLDLFFTNYSIPELVGRPPFQVSVDGGYQQTADTSLGSVGESHLDLQYGMGLVGPSLNVTLYQVGDGVDPNTSFNNFLDAVDGSYCTYEGGDDASVDAIYPDDQSWRIRWYVVRPPDCGTSQACCMILYTDLSIRYGYNEADLTPAYVMRQCNEYAKLGLMGVTILYSSGDYGVAGGDDLCLDEDGSQGPGGTRFNPTFPGVCPYVTSVGATQIAPGNTAYDPEVALAAKTSLVTVYSNVFQVPDYQKDAVATYLTNFKTDDFTSAAYNSSGTSRGLPDIAVNGAAFVVAAEGEFLLQWGTSASTPTLGAILAMINDARLAAGKSTIGFINPTIYSAPFQAAFNDITVGGNPGCGTEGFSTAVGWDPVTGLGTPNFEKLKELWLALP